MRNLLSSNQSLLAPITDIWNAKYLQPLIVGTRLPVLDDLHWHALIKYCTVILECEWHSPLTCDHAQARPGRDAAAHQVILRA